MVIKTEACNYTEYKVYPGRGQRFVAKDGKVHFLINHKAACMFHQRIKPAKLRWTVSWRRANKKLKTEDVSRKKNRKTTRIQRAIVGLSLEDLRRKRAERPEGRKAATEQAVKDHKEKAKKKAEAQKAAAGKGAKPQQQKATKQMPKGNKSATTGKRF